MNPKEPKMQLKERVYVCACTKLFLQNNIKKLPYFFTLTACYINSYCLMRYLIWTASFKNQTAINNFGYSFSIRSL